MSHSLTYIRDHEPDPQADSAGRKAKVPVWLLLRRIEQAESAVCVDLETWGKLLSILLPEMFGGSMMPAEPTSTLPGTAEHEAILAGRVERRESTSHPGDAQCPEHVGTLGHAASRNGSTNDAGKVRDDGTVPWRDYSLTLVGEDRSELPVGLKRLPAREMRFQVEMSHAVKPILEDSQ